MRSATATISLYVRIPKRWSNEDAQALISTYLDETLDAVIGNTGIQLKGGSVDEVVTALNVEPNKTRLTDAQLMDKWQGKLEYIEEILQSGGEALEPRERKRWQAKLRYARRRITQLEG